jgi:hypothetical protein
LFFLCITRTDHVDGQKEVFFGKHKEGQKLKGAVKELGSKVYVSDVSTATDKFVKMTEVIADYVSRVLGKEPMCDLVNGIDKPPVEPELPTNAKKDGPEARKWDRNYSHYLQQRERYRLSKGKVFVIILGQCTLAVKNRLKSLGTDYAQLQLNDDVLGLLTAIRNIALANANIQNPYWGAAQAFKRLATVSQQHDESLPAFYKRWTNARDVAKLATLKTVESETDETEGTVSELVEDNFCRKVRNKFQASLYLASVNMSKHGKVIDELQHQYLNKQDNYPSTPEDAMTMLSHHQDTPHKKKFHKDKEKTTEDGIGITNFAQQTQSNSNKKKSDTKDNNDSSISSRVFPNTSLSAGMVKTVSLHWKQQECVGDRIITFYILQLQFRILTITMAIIFFKDVHHDF